MALPWSLLVMPLIDSGSPSLFAVAVVGMYAIGGFGFGPTASFIPELFATSYRYTGSALAANLAGVAGGALPPVIAGALVATYGSWAIGVMLAILALISLVCTYRLPETAGSALVSR
ncbi:MFS transporter [Mycobacterium tuberculosis]|uniref:MFS transporter n=1 Tax=Mycobacterium tuberculosis TaxID=1773 RepID=UPI001EEDAF24|nr:MFS transporter [Mycobacterium tuberculosis]